MLPRRIEQVPRDRLREVAVRLLDQQAIPEIEHVAVERQLVAVAEPRSAACRLPDQVERDVGEAEVDLERPARGRTIRPAAGRASAHRRRGAADSRSSAGSSARRPQARRMRPRRSLRSARRSAAATAIRCASPRPGCRRRSGGGRSCSPPARTARPACSGSDATISADGTTHRLTPSSAACRYRARGGARAPRQEHERCQRGDAKGRPWHGRKPPRAASHHSRRLPRAALGFMRGRRLAHPGAILPRVAPRLSCAPWRPGPRRGRPRRIRPSRPRRSRSRPCPRST